MATIQGATMIQSATPDTLESDIEINGIESLIEEIDRVFAALQTSSRMGDYVKFDAAADLILDIRCKASTLLN